ncbi:hypothetical protein DIZ47_00355 [Legionella taurinensis]|uniref:Uncharacterized protein n=1 Tax=Legionella taurinensis TaxID=70611 RepID=A0A3A5L7Z7_9GAMM|nr:hypothetical protein [Legionella taurinensis]MDX1836675.1 hypothetical protein [Legionella taurinensis]PUT42870.1 hypothetical protein DB744_00355 [Legionella taurinensis]PUT45425.1 hypothetical protein DB746_00355 [Legionella taurinensis]PUT47000.1 hypothetical protein DB743_03645 [Legionella taurinensis]PUT49192.1 hypothetical protein DB745_00355 [Legionella taurinensis]
MDHRFSQKQTAANYDAKTQSHPEYLCDLHARIGKKRKKTASILFTVFKYFLSLINYHEYDLTENGFFYAQALDKYRKAASHLTN